MEVSLLDTGLRSKKIHFLQFNDGHTIMQTEVFGILANSIPTSDRGKERLLKWKPYIAREICSKRGNEVHDPKLIYAISLLEWASYRDVVQAEELET